MIPRGSQLLAAIGPMFMLNVKMQRASPKQMQRASPNIPVPKYSKRCVNKGGGEQAGGWELQSMRIWVRTTSLRGADKQARYNANATPEAGAGRAVPSKCTGCDGRVNPCCRPRPHSIAHGRPQRWGEAFLGSGKKVKKFVSLKSGPATL